MTAPVQRGATFRRAGLPEWFQPLLQEAKRRAGSSKALAVLLGVSRPTIQAWEQGGNPTLETFASLVAYMKGDLTRALPAYQDQGPKHDGPMLEIWGQVAGGAVSLGGTALGTVPACADPWIGCRYWTLTTGPVGLLEIVGDSMDPLYPEGDYLVVRAPVNPVGLPERTPCVFREDDGNTFKILRRVGRRYIGEPINRAHDLVEFTRPEVQYVVIGSMRIPRDTPTAARAAKPAAPAGLNVSNDPAELLRRATKPKAKEVVKKQHGE